MRSRLEQKKQFKYNTTTTSLVSYYITFQQTYFLTELKPGTDEKVLKKSLRGPPRETASIALIL